MVPQQIKSVAGRYKIIRELGSGAMGRVFLADRGKGDLVAVKLLDKSLTDDSAEFITERFKAEFSILKDLSHPGINKVYDFGFIKDLGRYFFTSEYIDGRSFLHVAQRCGVDEIEEIFVQALRALEYLHSHGIIHCDVKSSNVLVKFGEKDSSYHVKLIDFGLAALETPDLIVGTPSYMAPEVILKNRPDFRADLYSLGVLVYTALTGLNPFSADEMKETLARQVNLNPDPPSKYNPEVAPYLDEITLKLLNKVPSERFPTAAHVIRAINLGGAKSYPVETRETFLGYLPAEGNLVGRKKELGGIRRQALSIKNGDAETPFGLCLEGERGTGRARLLSELKYFGQLNEMDVVELSSTDKGGLNEFNAKISKLLTDISQPTIVNIYVLGLMVTRKANLTTVHLLQRLANRIRSERAFSPIRAVPRVMIAFTGTPGEIPSLIHLLGIDESQINICGLKNFNKLEVKEYLSSLTGIEKLPDKLVAEFMRFTDGNPLFITEVVRSLIGEGLLFDKLGRWNREAIEDIGIQFERIRVPRTLNALLEKQYKEALPEEKGLLETLASWHRPVPMNGLQATSQAKTFVPTINSLVRRGLISFDLATASYSYANPLLRESVYSEMPTAKRFALHEAIADYLKEVRPNAHAEILWHRGRTSKLKAAIDALLDLAAHHLKRSEGLDATSLLDEALKRLEKGDYRLKEVLLHMGEALVLTRRYGEAIEVYKRAAHLLEKDRTASTEDKITICQKLGLVYIRNEELSKAKEALSKAQGYLGETGENALSRLSLTNLLARVYFLEGHLDQAIHAYRRTKDMWLKLPHKEKRHILNNDLAHVYLQKGELSHAEQEFHQDIKFFEKVDAKDELERSYYSMGELKRLQGDVEGAAHYFEKSIKIARKISDSEILLRAYNGLGNLFNTEKKFRESLYWYDRAFDLAVRTTEDSTASAIAINIGLIKSSEGDLEQALNYFKSAINFFDQAKKKTPLDLGYILRAHIELADIYRQKREFEKAEHELNTASEIARSSEGLEDQVFWIKKAEAELAKDQGEWASKEIQDSTLVEEIEPLKFEEASILDIHSKDEGDEMMTQKYYRYILEINKYLSGEMDTDFVLRTILKYALELSRAEAGLILLYDDAGRLQIRSSSNIELDDKLSEISVHIAKSAIEKDEMVVTEDAVADKRFKASESVILLGLKSVVCIPIHAVKRPIGVIYLENRSKAGAFEGIDQEILSAFADQAGIAIQNTSLINQLEVSEKQLKEELSETSIRLKQLDEEVKRQGAHLKRHYKFDRLVSVSPKMKEVFELLEKISNTQLSVLIVGESGTGKELVSRAIHYNSGREKRPFVAVNCGSIPPTLIESELFGYKAGAFTGATRDKKGLFEAAEGGTLFLDEITELDTSLQAKLLRVIQERELTRVGDTKPIQCDVRIITASNRDLDRMIRDNTFREDLYYRVSEIKIGIPPLRERTEDIPLLIEDFVSEYCAQHHIKKTPKVDVSFIRACLSYHWPGNIRELENAVRVATALSDGKEITVHTLPANHVMRNYSRKATEKKNIPRTEGEYPFIDSLNRYDSGKTWKEFEAEIVASAYKATHFDAKETSRQLQIAVTTAYKKINELGLKDRSNPLLSTSFSYEKGTSLEKYRDRIFKVAWEYAGRRPYEAIRALGVSQGYFYRVMKQW